MPYNPADGSLIAEGELATTAQYEQVMATADRVQKAWRMYPAPKRGEIVRQMAEALRAHREDLGALVSLEVGKIRGEGVGEVQEAIENALRTSRDTGTPPRVRVGAADGE